MNIHDVEQFVTTRKVEIEHRDSKRFQNLVTIKLDGKEIDFANWVQLTPVVITRVVPSKYLGWLGFTKKVYKMGTNVVFTRC